MGRSLYASLGWNVIDVQVVMVGNALVRCVVHVPDESKEATHGPKSQALWGGITICIRARVRAHAAPMGCYFEPIRKLQT